MGDRGSGRERGGKEGERMERGRGRMRERMREGEGESVDAENVETLHVSHSGSGSARLARGWVYAVLAE